MNSILVPIDFSETSENGLNYAVGLANYLSFKIILLHVDSIPLVNNEFQDLSYVISKSKEENLELLKNKAKQLKKDDFLIGDVDYFAESGDLKSTIEVFISEKNVDFVVMGITGHDTMLGKFLLGSNAVSLSREISVPLFIIPKNYKYKKINSIAYASNYDIANKTITGLIKIKNINSIFGSLLNVIHVIPNSHLIDEEESNLDTFVEKKLEQTNHKTFILTNDNVSKAILDFIENHNVDIVVLEQNDYSFFENLFHVSATKEVAFKSPIPILTFHV